MLSEWRIRFMDAHISNGLAIDKLRTDLDAYKKEMEAEEAGDFKELMKTEIKILEHSLADMENAHSHLENATS